MHKLIKKAGNKVPPVKKLIEENGNLQKDKGILQLQKGDLEADVRELKEYIEQPRSYLANKYITGSGIEIGAAQLPVKLAPGTTVRYVDVFTADELRKVWPQDYTKLDIVEVDVVDDGERLSKFKERSLDFIIANHFMEHCLDPIGTLINMYSKLRRDGILFFAIPDKRYTFDSKRPITTYEHLLEEHADKKKNFLREHTEEFVRLGEKHKGNIKKRTQELLDSEYRVHYHVWTSQEMLEFFVESSKRFDLDLEIIATMKHQHESIYLIQRTS